MKNIISKFQFHIDLAKSLYNIRYPTLLLIFFSPILIIILYLSLFLPRATRPFALLIVEENYPVELITFFGYFFAGILGLILAWQGWKRKEGFILVGIYTLFALGTLFIGMEEISWGQTFFGFETPSYVYGNMQAEMTIHNLQGLQGNSEYFFVAFGLGGLIGIWAFSYKFFRKVCVPAILILWFLIILIIGGIDLINDFVTIHTKFDTLVVTLSEVIEMLIALAGFLYLWLNSRMLSFGKLRKTSASEVSFEENDLTIFLNDARSIRVPLDWYPQLLQASLKEREQWQLTHSGNRVRWPALGVDVHIERFIAGIPSVEAQLLEYSKKQSSDSQT